MKAREFAPATPLDAEVPGPHVPPAEREAALRDALSGVELGAYDERIVEWAATFLDASTLRVFVSWLLRVRKAGESS